ETDASVACVFEGWAVLDFAFDERSAEALSVVLDRSDDISRIIEGAVDDRDGVVRLMMQMSGGGAPVTIYEEQLATPVPPEVRACPEREVPAGVTGADDEAAAGAGGDRPAADGTADDVPRPPAEEEALPSGTSDQQPSEPALMRL